MKARYLTLTLLCFSLGACALNAQGLGAPASEEREMQRLMQQADVNVRFDDAPLEDVLRTLAEASNMAYLGLPRPKEEITVDMTVRGNPFQALQLVAESYGYVPIYENGLWFFRPIREEQSKLYPKVYKLKHLHLNDVAATPSGGGSGGGGSGNMSSALPPKVDTNAFTSAPSRVIDDITTLLELDPAQLALTEGAANGQQPTAAATQTGFNPAMLFTSGNVPDMRASLGLPPLTEKRQPLKGRIISDPDQNTLFVIASREHHEWITTYLDAIDHKRKLVLLETRVVEVRDTSALDVGLDWSQTLGGEGYRLSLSDSERIDNNGDGAFDEIIGGGFIHKRWDGAILTGPELSVALRALQSTNNARSLQHPSQVTVNNRQVVLRNVTQQPFQSGSSSTSSGGASTNSNQTEFIPIGTTISLLPRVLDGGNVELNILIQVSDLLGFHVIDENQIPVTSARDYAGQAIVQTGNTLAIGGLETLGESQGESKVPILGDIPLLGLLFKRSQPEERQTKLIMFITATVLDDYSGGVSNFGEVDAFLRDVESRPVREWKKRSTDPGTERRFTPTPNMNPNAVP